MRAKAIIVLVVGLVFLAAELCHAVPFSNTFDFNSVKKGKKGPSYDQVGDSSNFGLSHGLGFDHNTQSMGSGSLTLYFGGVSPKAKNEKWSVVVNGYVVGTLNGGPSNRWLSQTFTFSSELMDIINNSSEPLKIQLVESTGGADTLNIRQIALNWDVNDRPVNPAPPVNPTQPVDPVQPVNPSGPPPVMPGSGPGFPNTIDDHTPTPPISRPDVTPGGGGDGTPAPVPEPATILLLGAGLGGFAAFKKKFKG